MTIRAVGFDSARQRDIYSGNASSIHYDGDHLVYFGEGKGFRRRYHRFVIWLSPINSYHIHTIFGSFYELWLLCTYVSNIIILLMIITMWYPKYNYLYSLKFKIDMCHRSLHDTRSSMRPSNIQLVNSVRRYPIILCHTIRPIYEM